MALAFFDKATILGLSNAELIKKQQQFEIKIAQTRTIKCHPDIIKSMEEVYNAITFEIDRRLDDGIMDEDELEDDL